MLNIKVEGRGGKKGDIEKALKEYKNKVRSTKMMEELRDRKEFVKPSVKKRKEMQKAIYVNKTYGDNNN